MQSSLILKIGSIWNGHAGASIKQDIDLNLESEFFDLDFKSSFTGRLTLMKIKDEIAALLNDCKIKINFTCSRCLKQFTFPIKILCGERHYRSSMRDYDKNETEFWLINMKDLTVDLKEFIRQEIILHFPIVPVCSKSCKGLCETCGTDLNKSSCKCKKEIFTANKPFTNLKKLFN